MAETPQRDSAQIKARILEWARTPKGEREPKTITALAASLSVSHQYISHLIRSLPRDFSQRVAKTIAATELQQIPSSIPQNELLLKTRQNHIQKLNKLAESENPNVVLKAITLLEKLSPKGDGPNGHQVPPAPAVESNDERIIREAIERFPHNVNQRPV